MFDLSGYLVATVILNGNGDTVVNFIYSTNPTKNYFGRSPLKCEMMCSNRG